MEQFPHSAHYVIAHSHGGNVAMLAARDGSIASRLAGVVCISTPFLIVAPRALGRGPRLFLAMGVALLGAFLLSAALWMIGLRSWVHWDPPRGVVQAPANFAFMLVNTDPGRLLFLGSCALSIVIYRLARGRASRAVLKLYRESRLPATNLRGKLLILRSPGDEASSGIGAGHLIRWLAGLPLLSGGTQLGRVVDWYAGWIDRRWPFRPELLAPVALLSIFVAVWSGSRISEDLSIGAVVFAVVAIAFFFLAAMLMIPAALVTVVLYVGAAIAVFAYVFWAITSSVTVGLDLALASGALEVTAESTPRGTWEVRSFPARSFTRGVSDTRAPRALAHSSLYDDQEALQTISAWLRDRSARG